MISINRNPNLDRIRDWRSVTVDVRGRETPDPVTNTAIATVLSYRALAYNGHTYRFGPTPFRTGAEAQRLMVALNRCMQKLQDPRTQTTETASEYAGLVAEAAALVGPLLLPTGRKKWRMKVWRWFGWHPLRNATESEVVALLHFFCACRTTWSDRFDLVDPLRN
jgi:hypothetical protein